MQHRTLPFQYSSFRYIQPGRINMPLDNGLRKQGKPFPGGNLAFNLAPYDYIVSDDIGADHRCRAYGKIASRIEIALELTVDAQINRVFKTQITLHRGVHIQGFVFKLFLKSHIHLLV